MGYIPESFWDESVSLGWPLGLEPELGGSLDSMNWGTMGWGYNTGLNPP